MSKEDQEEGQVGTATRGAIRLLLLTRLYAENCINSLDLFHLLNSQL